MASFYVVARCQFRSLSPAQSKVLRAFQLLGCDFASIAFIADPASAIRAALRIGSVDELRHVGRLNTRVLWFFMKGRRIVAVHGIRNKGQASPARDLDTARQRMRDWQQRHTT